jgi:hypothetical protein
MDYNDSQLNLKKNQLYITVDLSVYALMQKVHFDRSSPLLSL